MLDALLLSATRRLPKMRLSYNNAIGTNYAMLFFAIVISIPAVSALNLVVL